MPFIAWIIVYAVFGPMFYTIAVGMAVWDWLIGGKDE